MNTVLKNPLAKHSAMQKVTVVTLCIVMTLFSTFSGCKSDDVSKIDEDTFLKNLESVPFVTVPRDDLPESLNGLIDRMIEDYVGKPSSLFPGITKLAEIYRGEWRGQTAYYIRHVYSNCVFCVHSENGERIIWSDDVERQSFIASSKNWELIFLIENGEIIGEITTKNRVSVYSTKIGDKYKFPNFRPGTSEWEQIGVTQRISILQIPENQLSSISTEGLLETCLEFPYLIEIYFYNDFQKGFDVLSKIFNGYRELLKRRDLTDALIEKYYDLSLEVANVRSLTPIDQGMYSFRQFVLEFIIAQDVVLENLSAEQERELFLLTLEHTKIKNSYPDIFGGLSAIPTALLYAKKITNDNQVRADLKDAVTVFVKAPQFVGQNVINYLEDYMNVKFK